VDRRLFQKLRPLNQAIETVARSIGLNFNAIRNRGARLSEFANPGSVLQGNRGQFERRNFGLASK
jgi:hypothetical protein